MGPSPEEEVLIDYIKRGVLQGRCDGISGWFFIDPRSHSKVFVSSLSPDEQLRWVKQILKDRPLGDRNIEVVGLTPRWMGLVSVLLVAVIWQFSGALPVWFRIVLIGAALIPVAIADRWLVQRRLYGRKTRLR